MNRRDKRLRVLLSAYSCEPGFSSERGVGWNWAIQISRSHDVWVLTRESNRSNIENELNNREYPNLHFIYFDLPKYLRFWKKGEKGLYPYYTIWQFCTIFVALKWHKRLNFNLTHYLTFGSILLPTFIYFMPTRLIMGPIGGGGHAPLHFLGQFSFKGKLNEILRHLVQRFYRFNPLLYLQSTRADCILVRDKETLMMIPKTFREKAKIQLETGVPKELINYENFSGHPEDKELTLVTVGRFIHSKLNILTLKILQEFKERYPKPFKVYIVGDGNEKSHILEFIKGKSITENVVFTGWLSREEVFEILSESDIYFSTSFKDGGSWAFFEAIMMDLPVVCLKNGGPDIIVADNCGIKVPVGEPEQVINDFANGLVHLASNRELRKKMAREAKANLLEKHTWENMGSRMNELYSEVVP